MQLVLVLHAHLPWVRAERPWSSEERWLHEALWECYLPLLALIEGLGRDGVKAPLTLSLSPTLLAMWGDELLQRRFVDHLAALRRIVDAQRVRWPEAMDHYGRLIERASDLHARHGRDLGRSFGDQQRMGRVELLTTAATHALLPALAPCPRAIDVQLGLGRDLFEEATGVEPRGLWLPECALDPVVDAALARHDVPCTVVAEHASRFARPDPGPLAGRAPTPVISPRGVAMAPRHRAATLRIWSPEEGYPGHPVYREFHRDLGHLLADDELGPLGAGTMTGLKVHRITGGRDKALYDPDVAEARARCDAEDMVAWLSSRSDPLIVMAFDAELFGHWWHEGLIFLEHLLRQARGAGLAVTPLSEAMAGGAWPVAEPAPSTWGRGGDSHTWLGPTTAAHWRLVHWAWRSVEALWHRSAERSVAEMGAAERATRAALLLQASDWTFMMDGEATSDYARQHVSDLARTAEAWTMRARGEPASPDAEMDAPFDGALVRRWARR
jgi:1,4-alpha-glucan branching enzyme